MGWAGGEGESGGRREALLKGGGLNRGVSRT